MIARDLSMQSDGIVLRGTVMFPCSGGHWPLTVLCHGIPSGITTEGDPGYEALARRFIEQGVAACYFNFRGTGLSGGNFSLPGWASDLVVVLNAAEGGKGSFQGVDPGRITLMGFSGGGAISIICAAARVELKAVVALSSPARFTRLMARESMGAFIDHARSIGIIRDEGFPPSEEGYYQEMVAFTPLDKVARISPIPLLIVHGDEDDVVPVEEAYQLYTAASDPKELYIVKGGGHKLRLNQEAMDKALYWILEKLN